MSLSGTGWTCPAGVVTCTRADALSGGSSYPAITVTVNVASNAPSQVTNQATVSGGGSAGAAASDPTAVDVLLRYSNPLAFATSASVVAGVPTTLSVTYTSDNGPTDIASGQVMIDNCYFAWDRSNHLWLYGANGGGQVNGILGSSSTPLSAGNCSIDLANSSLSTPAGNPKASVLKLAVTFPAQAYPSTDDNSPAPNFLGPHEVYAWGTSAEGLNTGQMDLGSLVVSQGQDFALNVAIGNSLNVGTNSTVNLTVAAAGLNGFNGSIVLGTQTIAASGNGGYCFVFVGSQPTSIQANGQATFTLRNNGCQTGSILEFTVHGTANGIRRLTSFVTLVASGSADFTIAVGPPSPAVLLPQSSVSYLVTVSSVNGLAGYVGLSVSGLPPGVSSSLSQVYLPANGTATTYLTLYGSTSIAPGTYTPQITGTLVGAHTATFSLSTLSR